MIEVLMILSVIGLFLSYKNMQHTQKGKTVKRKEKTLLAIIILIGFNLPLQAQIQPYIGIGFYTNGIGLNLGAVENNVCYEVGLHKPLVYNDVPTLIYGKVGYEINLSGKEKDNFTITPSLGISSYMVNDYVNYEHDGSVIKVKSIKSYYSLELGKDWFMGRLFINGGYCGNAFFGAGMKIFFNRN